MIYPRDFFKEEWKLSHQVVSVVEAWMLYIKKDDFVSFGIILDEVNGGWRLPGKEMCRGKKWIVVGHHPVGPWWKPWIIIWTFQVMEVWVLNQTLAEQRAAEKPVCAPFSSVEEHRPVLP